MAATIITNERLAREAEHKICELDEALSSDQALKSIAQGLPREVLEGVRRSLKSERAELSGQLDAFKKAKDGDYEPLQKLVGNDPGAFLIAARIMKGLSQKDLGRKLGLRETMIQRWEAERYRTITLSNYQKIAQILGVRWRMEASTPLAEQWGLSYEVSRDELSKVLKHARAHGWLAPEEGADDNAVGILLRYVGDHVIRYGTPSLLRTGMRTNDRPDNWSLLSWKAQVTRRAEAMVCSRKLRYQPMNVSWLMDLVHLSQFDDGPVRARDLLFQHGIVLVIEPQIAGMSLDGASFLAGDIPVIGLTLLRDSLDNFWFTLLHEVAHIILHYRTGLSAGFFDDLTEDDIDEFEVEANQFAGNLLIPEEAWARSPARISKTVEPIERFAEQLGISPAIVFGRIRMERNNYSIFSNQIGRGVVRKLLRPESREQP